MDLDAQPCEPALAGRQQTALLQFVHFFLSFVVTF